jgi:ABC-type lipoprotein release transport system permease subunit
MSALLYQTRATDTLSYVVATLALTVAAFFATLIPSRRAANVDPVVALRAE